MSPERDYQKYCVIELKRINKRERGWIEDVVTKLVMNLVNLCVCFFLLCVIIDKLTNIAAMKKYPKVPVICNKSFQFNHHKI
jgi:hypothetical protein